MRRFSLSRRTMREFLTLPSAVTSSQQNNFVSYNYSSLGRFLSNSEPGLERKIISCSFFDKVRTIASETNSSKCVDTELNVNYNRTINKESEHHNDIIASQVRHLDECSVYVHWPYCSKLCSYCNFVKFVPKPGTSWTIDDDVIEQAMVREIQHVLKASPARRVTSVFFGGGTPSLARPLLVERVLEGIRDCCKLVEGAEVTLEGNPSSLSRNSLRAFIQAGINRVSIGVQTLERGALSALRRDHSHTDAVASVEAAHALLPKKVSIDLLFGRHLQTLPKWKQELSAALELAGDHIALYQLTVEPGTPLYRQVRAGIVTMPCADVVADMYEHAVSSLASHGLSRYEVANFASSEGCQSHHNKNYWRAGQYVGIGPGAHSRVLPLGMDLRNWREETRNSDLRTPQRAAAAEDTSLGIVREERVNAPDPAAWLREVKRKGHGTVRTVGQTKLSVLSEYLASGLRTVEGVTAQRWTTLDQRNKLTDVFSESSIEMYTRLQLLTLTEKGLKPTDKGINVIDSILPDLLNILKRKYN